MIIQTAFIGDVILATSVAETLHQQFPNASIDMLVRKGNESLLTDHPFLNKVLILDKETGKYRNIRHLIIEIRKREYDHVINLHRFASSGWITVRSGARETIGFDKNPLSRWYDIAINHEIGQKGDKQYLHETERNQELVRHLVGDTYVKPRLYPSADDENIVQQYVQEPYITISPASVWFTKQLPADKWAALINELKGVKVYLLGSKADLAVCNGLVNQTAGKPVISLAGQLSLLQSAALMDKAIMNFTNDSAPMHLASAMNAPVCAVYCSTIPEFGFGPLSDVQHIVQKDGLACRPCGLHGHRACPEGHFSCSDHDMKKLADLVTSLLH